MTIRINLNAMEPILRGWADQGHSSLAEISREDIVSALARVEVNRQVAEQGLRSLFTILKARKLVFINPLRGLRATKNNATVPTTAATETIRQALNDPDPASALAVALVVFHALTATQIRQLKLTDFSDGRLNLDGRSIPLAGAVRTRLGAWLDHRAGKWPATTNPYLLINRRTAARNTPPGPNFLWINISIRPFARREDRILQEIHANGADARRICDLFCMSIEGALRYTATVEHPDLQTNERNRAPGSV